MSGPWNDPETDSSGPRSGRASSQERKSKWPHTRDERATAHTQVPSPYQLSKDPSTGWGGGDRMGHLPFDPALITPELVLGVPAQGHGSEAPGGSCKAGKSKAGNNQGPPGGRQWVNRVVPTPRRETPA